MGKQYGYIRVSTKEQNIARQMAALMQHNISEENIYCDHLSGKDFNRPGYRKLLKKIKPGDLLVIKSIDRLGRNYDEILQQWKLITKDRGVDILVLDMELLDTRKSEKNLTGTLIADLVLQVLAYVAQIEREFIKQRQAEGIAVAREKGIRFGRPRNKLPENFTYICRECYAGIISTRKAAEQLGLSHSTFYRNYRYFIADGTDNKMGED